MMTAVDTLIAQEARMIVYTYEGVPGVNAFNAEMNSALDACGSAEWLLAFMRPTFEEMINDKG